VLSSSDELSESLLLSLEGFWAGFTLAELFEVCFGADGFVLSSSDELSEPLLLFFVFDFDPLCLVINFFLDGFVVSLSELLLLD